MSNPQIHLFNSHEALAEAAAASIATALSDALDKRGRASLALSGGSSPRATYEALAQADIAWPGVAVTLVDERWVPSGHPKSNADFIQACLADTPAARSHFVPLYNGHDTPEAGVEAANQALDLIAQPFDMVVMGMGGDAHTASWFPNMPDLATALDPDNPDRLCAADATGQAGGSDLAARMTLTFSAVAAARHCVLLLPSAEKLDVFTAARSKPVMDAPVKSLYGLGDTLTVFALET